MRFALDGRGLDAVGRLAARWLASAPDELTIELAPEGRSTPVFRIERGGETFYLRLSEHARASLGAEALAHELLIERGARVPAAIGYEPFDDTLQRSVMLTSAIPGQALETVEEVDRAPILFAAGADLARIHQLPVDGFGWILRDDPHPINLSAPHRNWSAFAAELTVHELDRWFDRATQNRLSRLARVTPADESIAGARLAHGDFDGSHIFQEGGRFSGIIDFGEIRGAEPTFDLGHLALHATDVLPPVLRGYRSVSPLPENAAIQIAAAAIRIGWFRLTQSSAGSNAPYAAELVRAMERIAIEAGGVFDD